MDLSKLNKEQKEAVTFGEGPLLIVAGAGTGKTTVLTHRIAYLIGEKGVKPEEILAVTFTEKAAKEMEERVEGLLSFGYYDLWISTFHSFCDRVLKNNGISIGLPTNYKLVDSTGSWVLIRKNFEKFKFLKEYRPLGNPTKFIHALVSHFSHCKNEGIYPENYLEHADSLKFNFDDSPASVSKEESLKKKEYERIKEIAQAYHTYQKLLLDNSVLDFGDLINYTLKLFEKRPDILEKLRNQFKYIMVDEFQDTNWVQYELIAKLAEPKNNITVVADDDQCLVGNNLIDTWKDDKIKKIKIKDIKKNDVVLTAVGKGHLGFSRVANISKNRKKAELITITTKSGNKITVTDNHKMFCMVPSSDRRKRSNYYYVYLMFRNDIGWRMGKTDNVIGRLRLERSADNIIALRAFNNDSDARYYETLWSLKYGIPTSCFCKRKGVVIKDDLLNKLYQEIDVNSGISRLAKDLNVDLNSSHYYLDAVNRGNKKRIKIIIQLCYRSCRTKNLKGFIKKPRINHILRIETSINEAIEKIEKAGFKMRKAKKGKKFVFVSGNIREVGRAAKEMQELIGGFIEFRFYAGLGYDVKNKIRKSNPSIVMPAKNLVHGHYLPIKRDNDVVYDEIIDIKRKVKKDYVYDLEIEKTHNFLAQGIIIHNSIFSFQGSSFNNVLRFKKDYPKSEEVVLVNNYRSPQNILDLSYSFIQNNNPNRLEFQLNEVEGLRKQAEEKGVDLGKIKKFDKKLKSQKKRDGMVGVLAYETGDDEIRGIISKIWEIKEIDKKAKFSDFAILTRTNEAANNFSRALERAGMPYQFLSSKGLYTHPLILDFISYFNLLMNFYDSASFYRVLRMHPFDFSVNELAKITYYAEEKGLPISEALNQIQLLTSLSKESKEKVESLVKNIKKHFQISKEKNVGEVFVSMINDLGFIDHFSKNNEEDFKVWDTIDQFYHRIREFEDSHFDAKLVSFMEHIQMEMEAGEEGSLKFDIEDSFDSVKIMTIHSAKGLEFDYVFLVNLVHRKFPTDEKREPIEIPSELIKEVLPQGDFHLQEERRLFYVGLTRARKGLFLAWALDYGGKTLKKPSRFLIESNLIHEEALNKQKFSRSSSFCFNRGNNNGFKKESKETETINGIRSYLPDHFSFSQIASFNNCPLQYKFSHVLKIPAKGRPNFSFGKTIHNTLYHFTKIATKGLKTEQESLFGKGLATMPIFNDLIDIYKKEWIDEWYDETLRKEYFEKGKECLKLFYDDFINNKPNILIMNHEPALEKVFELRLNGDSFIGAIDRIDEIKKGEVEIIDYKTGTPKTSLGTDEKLQLLIYQLAAKKIFNLNATKLTYYYLEDGSVFSFCPKEEEIEKTEEKIREVVKKIKRSNFKPVPGWHCQYCDYRNICPHRKSGI